MAQSNTRFFFDTDDDGHNYLIPVGKREAFLAWLEFHADIEEEAIHDPGFDYLGALRSYDGLDFDEHRIDDISSYSFEMPERDQ